MKKTLKLTSVLLALLLLIVSCSPEKQMDGKTAETKKQMTETEYSQNREAIRGVSVVEAYAVAYSENAEASSRALEGDFKLTFKDEEISSSVIISKLLEKAEVTENEAEKAFYTTLSSTIPPNFTLKIKNGSFVNFKVNNDGFKVVSSLNVTIFIGDKTIKIEKDVDEKWVEIDGTFFDDSELEKMLDKAEEAAESIEEFFTNIKIGLEDLKTIIDGTDQKIKNGDFGKDATATGSYSFKLDDKGFVSTFDYEYYENEEEDEKIKVAGTISFSFDSIKQVYEALFTLTDEDDFENLIESARNTISVKI
ncbi:MAG: hypothetical protein ACI4SI_10915, partial [Candidatus Ornithospirochaeta sp.]